MQKKLSTILYIKFGGIPPLAPEKFKKQKNIKTKRGKRKSEIRKKNQFTENSMFILGGNAAGLLNKKSSFLRNILIFKPAAYLIQETKVNRKNQLLVDDYVIFEHVRKVNAGGGVLTAVHKALDPISIGDEIDGEEFVVVEATLGDKKLRLINGYAPQETETEKARRN